MVGYNLVKKEERKKALVSLSIIVFLTMFCAGMINPLLSVFSKSMGASGTVIGFVFFSFFLARFLGIMIVGEIADKVNRKLLLTTGVGIYSVCYLLYSFATNPLQLIFMRFLHGIGASMSGPVAMTIGGGIAPQGEEGKYMSRVMSALYLGFGIGPLVGGIIVEKFSFHVPFYVASVIALCALVLVLFLSNKTIHADLIAKREKTTVSKDVRMLTLLKYKEIASIVLFRILTTITENIVFVFLPVYGIMIKIPYAYITAILSINTFTTSFLQYFTGELADKIDRRALLISGGIIKSIAVLGIFFANSFCPIFLFWTLNGIGTSLIMPSLGATAATIGAKYGVGKIMGLLSMAFTVGMGIAPILGGITTDYLGIKNIFLIGFFIQIIGSISLLLPRTNRS